MATGCSCQSENKKQEPRRSVYSTDYDGVLPDLTKGAEHIIATHRQTMFTILDGGVYYWYETKFTFAGTLTTDGETPAIKEVTSTFQTFSPDLCYTITTDAKRGTLIPAPVPGLWIEDFDLSKCDIKLTVSEAIDKLKEWNGVLPPSTFIILRRPVGPVACNAQYVVGNPFTAVWVDAVTGKVADRCPAFPDTIGKPLGEWP